MVYFLQEVHSTFEVPRKAPLMLYVQSRHPGCKVFVDPELGPFSEGHSLSLVGPEDYSAGTLIISLYSRSL